MTHLSQFLFATSIQGVLADLHELLKEHVSNLREATAGGLHQRLQDGVDVGLDAGPEELLRFGENQSCRQTSEEGGG